MGWSKQRVGTKHHDSVARPHDEELLHVPLLRQSVSGGSGHQPTWESLLRHATHAGAQTSPGIQTQPQPRTMAQRP